MSVLVCRWGILGTSVIGRKVWQAIGRTGTGQVVAVASRDRARAARYINACQRHFAMEREPRAYGAYEAILDDDGIDAVYLPLPTGVRKEWVIRAAQAGKHVLCEKPCALSVADLEEMLRACDDHGVQFMDGVMFMHSARLPAIRIVLDDPQRIGTIRRIASQFSFCADPIFFRNDIRVNRELEPFGCLGDLGWYNIRWALWVMGGRMPRQVIARTLRSSCPDAPETGVPIDFSAELIFDDQTSASFYCSFVTHHQQWAHVSGTAGTLFVPDFVLPYYGNAQHFYAQRAEFNTTGWDFGMAHYLTVHEIAEYSNAHEQSPEVSQFRVFHQLVNERRLDPQWPIWALKTQRILNACL